MIIPWLLVGTLIFLIITRFWGLSVSEQLSLFSLLDQAILVASFLILIVLFIKWFRTEHRKQPRTATKVPTGLRTQDKPFELFEFFGTTLGIAPTLFRSDYRYFF